MHIIGHRGAAGLELENTMASIQAALNYRVEAIEIDVRKTKDKHLVLCHDADLQRVADDQRRVRELTLKQIQKIPLLTGAVIPTLEEALELIGDRPVVIELKESGCLDILIAVLKNFPEANISVASFKHAELVKLSQLQTGIKVYGLERTKPFDIIHNAKRLGLNGLGLNYWLLNPLTYWLCRRANLDIYIYTLDNAILARAISTLYPKVSICTNFPNRFVRKVPRSV